MLYSKNNFAFQHINRTGGLSVKSVLLSVAGEPDDGSAIIEFAHMSLVDCLDRLKKVCPETDMSDVAIYTNIRDPFSRLVSIYSFRHGKRGIYKGRSFGWFFHTFYMSDKSDITTGPTRPFMVDEDGNIHENLEVVRFEELSEKWPEIVLKHFGVEVNHWPKVNISNHESPMKYFTDSMIEIVLDRDKWFIERFYPELL